MAAATVAGVLDLRKELERHHGDAIRHLACVDELLSLEEIAWFHRLQGVVALRDDSALDAAQAWQAARTVYPALSALPGQSESWKRIWQQSGAAGTVSRLPTVEGIEWVVNGLATPVRTARRPSIVQLVDDRSTVLWSGWIAGGAAIPDALQALIGERLGPRTVIPPVARGFVGPFVQARGGVRDAHGDRVGYRQLERIAWYDQDGRKWKRRQAGAGWGLAGSLLLTSVAGYVSYLAVWDAAVGNNVDPRFRPLSVGAPIALTALGTTLAVRGVTRRRRARREVIEAASRVAGGEAR